MFRRVALPVAAALLFPSTNSVPRFAVSKCTWKWRPAETLETIDHRPAYSEAPTAIVHRGVLTLLGTPAFEWAEKNDFDPPPAPSRSDTLKYFVRLKQNHGLVGFTVTDGARAIPLRPPAIEPIRKLVADRDDGERIAAIWFGPGPSPKDEDNHVVRFSELADQKWSKPITLFAADRFDWSGQRPTLLTANKEVHVFLSFTRGDVSGIEYLRRIRGKWISTEHSLPGLPSQGTGALLGRDSIVIVYAGVGAPGVHTRNGQHLFAIRAARSASVWPKPTMIAWSGLHAVRWTRLYSTPRSQSLTIVWARIPAERLINMDTLLAATSLDGGATWSSVRSLALPFLIKDLSQVADSTGTIHVVVTARQPTLNAMQLYHVMFDRGRWSTVEALNSGTVASSAKLSITGRNSLLLAWGETLRIDRNGNAGEAPVTKYSTLTNNCVSDGT